VSGTEAFLELDDKKLAQLFRDFCRTVAEAAGTNRFHVVMAFYTTEGCTSICTSGDKMTDLAILERIMTDIMNGAGERDVGPLDG